MKKTSRSSQSTLNELNITPLLDLVFVLLVIFIITTPQLVNNLEMALPSAQPPPPNPNAPKPVVHRITVAEGGQAYLDERPLDLATLRGELEKLKTTDPGLAVVVKGGDEVEYQGLVSVLDILRQLEIRKVGLATVEGDGGGTKL